MLFLRRLLILSHRYLGIVISLAVVVWFASGIVMMYAGTMPALDPDVRLERLPEIDFARVRLSPHEAAQRAGEAGVFGRPSLTTVMDRPAYRFQGRVSDTVFADTGEGLQSIDADTARTIASRFLDVSPKLVTFELTLHEPDQWTLGLRDDLLHKFVVNDFAATHIYVSSQSAEVSLVTTRSQRALAWLGTIPHWIYFTGVRTNGPLWFKVVVWLSSLACVLAVLGMILTVTQFRRSKPFRWSLAVPYRGWMRWHYILGALFGVFAFTWSFSGLLSMEPFDWTNARGIEIRRDVFSEGELDLATFGAIDGEALQRVVGERRIKEIGFTRIHGENYYSIAVAQPNSATPRAERSNESYDRGSRGARDRLLVAARTLSLRDEPFANESILERLRAALPPDVRIQEHTLLTDYDDYYYSRGRLAPLPVLRIKLDDPAQSWIYVDVRTSSIVAQLHRLSRRERWLYHGLHSLDFKFWYSKRPLWDIGMLVLLLGGLAMSTLGLYLGIKRLIRDLTSFTVRSG